MSVDRSTNGARGASRGGLQPDPDVDDGTERLRYERTYWRGL